MRHRIDRTRSCIARGRCKVVLLRDTVVRYFDKIARANRSPMGNSAARGVQFRYRSIWLSLLSANAANILERRPRSANGPLPRTKPFCIGCQNNTSLTKVYSRVRKSKWIKVSKEKRRPFNLSTRRRSRASVSLHLKNHNRLELLKDFVPEMLWITR